MKARRATLTAGTLAMLIAFAGCYGPVVPTVYEPGEYKGATDPLLKKLKTPELKEALQRRFSIGQTDR